MAKEDNMDDHVCQSCGMTMKKSQEHGTNADGSANPEFCTHCYQDGSFTSPGTMDDMVEKNLLYLDHWNEETGNSFSVDEARPMLREFLSGLKRWQVR